jgi:hypothetical protein
MGLRVVVGRQRKIRASASLSTETSFRTSHHRRGGRDQYCIVGWNDPVNRGVIEIAVDSYD